MHRRRSGGPDCSRSLGVARHPRRLPPAVVRLGGDDGEMTSVVAKAFDGPGIAGVHRGARHVALIALPYADRSTARTASIAAILMPPSRSSRSSTWRCSSAMFVFAPEGFLPNRAPGLWVTAIGVIALARAAYDIAAERLALADDAGRRRGRRGGPRPTRARGSGVRIDLDPQEAHVVAWARRCPRVASGGPRPGTGRGVHGRPPQASERRGGGRLADAWPSCRRARGSSRPYSATAASAGRRSSPVEANRSPATAQSPRRPA